MHTLLINVDELWLKQGKRPYYMRSVKNHIGVALKSYHEGTFLSKVDNQRLVIESEAPFVDSTIEALQKIPGIHSLAKAHRLPLSESAIIPAVLEQLADLTVLPATFAVHTTRGNKQFLKKSVEVSRDVGAAVLQAYPHFRVNLSQPELRIQIKITCRQIFIVMKSLAGIGGIPTGTSGHVVSLLSGGFDSPVASYLMSKRGCRLTMVFFHAYPFVGDEIKHKIRQLATCLGRYQKGCKLYIIPFGELQQQISQTCKKEYRTLLFRHYMIKAADQLAHRVHAEALCLGDALSQVSSQTMHNIAILDRSVVRPILRPLIGFNKAEIIALAKEIGTHDVSVIPQDDACSLLAPKHPVVKPYHRYWTYFTNSFPFDDEIKKSLDNAESYDVTLAGELSLCGD